MKGELEVKGSSIRSKLVFLETNSGRDVAAEFEKHLESLGVPSILDARWYPYSTYNDALRWITNRCFDGDLGRLEEVGKFSAHQALTTTYDIFVARSDFPGFLKRISTLHGRFYSQGKLVVTFADEGSCRLEILETPGLSEPDTHVARGFYVGAAELLGLGTISCEHTRRPDGAVFQLSW